MFPTPTMSLPPTISNKSNILNYVSAHNQIKYKSNYIYQTMSFPSTISKAISNVSNDIYQIMFPPTISI